MIESYVKNYVGERKLTLTVGEKKVRNAVILCAIFFAQNMNIALFWKKIVLIIGPTDWSEDEDSGIDEENNDGEVRDTGDPLVDLQKRYEEERNALLAHLKGN